jgi:hypothetical protein
MDSFTLRKILLSGKDAGTISKERDTVIKSVALISELNGTYIVNRDLGDRCLPKCLLFLAKSG